MAAAPKYAYKHITTGTTLVKNGTGTLAAIVINKATTGTITVSDGASIIGIIAIGAAASTMTYGGAGGIQFGTQLSITCSATEDLTISYE